MYFRKFLAFLVVALLGAVTAAQAAPPTTVQAQATVSWVAPATDANGNALTGSNVLTGFNMYLSTTPLSAVPSAPTATTGPTGATVAGTITAHPGDTVYAYVTACNAQGCSVMAGPGTKVITLPNTVPDIPTQVTVAITITTGP